jgi:hypothetical protein
MGNVVLTLKSKRHTVNFLFLQQFDGSFVQPENEMVESNVYNDGYYQVFLCFENNTKINSVKFLVNSEIIQTARAFEQNENKVEIFPMDARIFLDCFGVAQMEVIADGIGYISKNVPIMVHNNDINNNVINMIDYIYEHGERYLYENQKHSKVDMGIKTGNQKSIEVKLDVLKQTLMVYKKYYEFFIKSPKRKLVNKEITGSFEKLGTISFKTIQHIVTHPEELQAVSYDTGIKINGQNFQPRNSLISTTAYSEDIYENQVIVGFLKTIIRELQKIDNQIRDWLLSTAYSKHDDEYINSVAYIYSRSNCVLMKYQKTVENLRQQFKLIYFNYSKTLKTSHSSVVALPMYTKVFQSVKAYSMIYRQIFEWFKYGNYNIEKSNAVFSFISTSKIYEYFCLIKLNTCLEKYMGYKSKIDAYLFRYPETKAYINTRYNNTFEFINTLNSDESVTIYFQPIIHASDIERNNIKLFRNTRYSFDGLSGTAYTPDYILKIIKNNVSKYFILDAKFSKKSDVVKYQLPKIAFRYWFSISTTNPNDSISGICLLCGKGDGKDKIESIYNTVNAQSRVEDIKPSAKIVELNGTNVDDYNQIKALLIEYVSN